MGLHVCAIGPDHADPRGEWVEVANDGYTAVQLTGLKISDYTATQQRSHVYEFPALSSGAALTLPSRRSAYVFTGPGRSEILGDGTAILFIGRRASIWNNTGDVAYLRRADGTFIDSLTVGSPRRHPNGH